MLSVLNGKKEHTANIILHKPGVCFKRPNHNLQKALLWQQQRKRQERNSSPEPFQVILITGRPFFPTCLIISSVLMLLGGWNDKKIIITLRLTLQYDTLW